MKESKKRLGHYSLHSAPTPDDPYYNAIMSGAEERIKQDLNNPKKKRLLEDKRKKALSIAFTQSQNGLGFLQDNELRYFQQEFNSRLWNHGFGSMPSSFRVLEGMYKWRPDLFMFEIFEEEEHLFSFFDFVDFVTSDKCSNTVDYFVNNVEDDLVHTYNILNEVDEITFNTLDSLEYVIGGVSILKRGNEAFLMIISGEKNDLNGIQKDLLEKRKKSTSGKSYIKAADKLKHEPIGLFGKDNIWKVNVYLRIDLDTKTIDLRYIQKDEGDSFSTITDDVGMLKDSIPDLEEIDVYMNNHVKQLENYDAIFEIAYKCLHLPEYFNYYDDEISSEEHPTHLFNETLKRSPLRTIQFDSKYFIKLKDVWVLDKRYQGLSKDLILETTELQVQKEGYWQQLPPGQLGRGKNGEPIHNRTWIEKTLTWFETIKPKEVHVKIPDIISQNSGYIYIMRNASHELDIFKIGLTTKTAEERARQLSSTTASPDKFLVIYKWKVQDCYLAEKMIHEALADFRTNPSREFFKIDLSKALPKISEIIDKINA